MEFSNGALVHWPTEAASEADLSITLTRPDLLVVLTGGTTDRATFEGDVRLLGALIGLLDAPDPEFSVVTP